MLPIAIGSAATAAGLDPTTTTTVTTTAPRTARAARPPTTEIKLLTPITVVFTPTSSSFVGVQSTSGVIPVPAPRALLVAQALPHTL